MPTLTTSPFTILIDTREQLPYTFANVRADAVEGGQLLTVPTRRCTLEAGDYSIDGYAKMVVVERKSASDLAGTLTAGRRRFLAELDRLRNYDAAWIVCESELSQLCKGVPWAPQFTPRTIFRSVMFWQLRYPQIRWWAVPGREVAENVTYQLLRTWWRERIDSPARAARRREDEAWRSATAKASAAARATGARRGGRGRSDNGIDGGK